LRAAARGLCTTLNRRLAAAVANLDAPRLCDGRLRDANGQKTIREVGFDFLLVEAVGQLERAREAPKGSLDYVIPTLRVFG
jgi:hypothetical protein